MNSEEQGFLTLVRDSVFTALKAKMSEVETLKACFQYSAACPSQIAAQLGEILEGIRLENSTYRKLIGVYRVEQLKKYQFKLVPFAGLPSITIYPQGSNPRSEFSQILRLSQYDHEAIRRAWLPQIANPIANRDPELQKADFFARAERDRLQFYEVQLLGILSRYEFLLFMDQENPKEADVALAFEKMLSDLHSTLDRLQSVDRTALGEFLNFQPAVEGVVAAHQELKTIARQLGKRWEHELNSEPRLTEIFKKNWVDMSLLSCSLVAGFTQAWPVAVGCAAGMTAHSALDTIELWHDYRHSYENFIAALIPYHDFNAAQSKLAFSFISDLLAATVVGNEVREIEGSIVAGLQRGAKNLKKNLSNWDDFQGTMIVYGSELIADERTQLALKTGSISIAHGGFRKADYEQLRFNDIHTSLLPNGKGEVLFLGAGFPTFADLIQARPQ